MNSTDAIQEILSALKPLKERGDTSVKIENLEAYLGQLFSEIKKDDSANPHELERIKASFQLELENAKAKTVHSTKMFESVIEAGQTALNAGMLINGGGATAALAFLGNLLTKSPTEPARILVIGVNSALLAFIAGVAVAGIATGLRYLSQRYYAFTLHAQNRKDLGQETAYRRVADRFSWGAVVCGFSAFAAFCIGGMLAFRAISQ